MLFVPILAVVVSSVSAGWIVPDTTELKCNLEGGLSELTFTYASADLEIKDSMKAGICNKDTDDADFKVDSVPNADDNTQTITVTFNSYSCSEKIFNPNDEATYGTALEFEFDSVLKGIDGQDYVQQQHKIPVACKLEREYTVEYDFGRLYAKPAAPEDNAVSDGVDFQILAYKTEARQEINDMAEAKSGQMAYLALVPKYELPDKFSYAPTTCTFREDKCEDDTMEVCTNENSYPLFENNGDDKDCQQAAPIKFKIDWDKDEKAWLIEYMLFVFTMEELNKYTLSCDVTLCDKQKSDAAELSICNKAATKCAGYDPQALGDNFAKCDSGGETCFPSTENN